MTDNRKYQDCIKNFRLPEGVPPLTEDQGLPPHVMSLHGFLQNPKATTTVEMFKINPGTNLGVGTGDNFFLPEPFGSRYYEGFKNFESFPYVAPNNVLYCFMGTDPERPEHLGATIEAWMGADDEAEQCIIDKPGVWLTPANVVHGPFQIREQTDPIIFVVILETPMMSMAPHKSRPKGFNRDKMVVQNKAERKYDKYFMDIDPRDIAVAASHQGKVSPMMFVDYLNNNEITRTIDCRMITEAGVSFGVGEDSGDEMFNFSTHPHTHHESETYTFAGLDQDNPNDLGGTVEFWIGKGDDAEKYIITEPTTIVIPKGTVHFPASVTEVHHPFMMLTVTDMPIWVAHWAIDMPLMPPPPMP